MYDQISYVMHMPFDKILLFARTLVVFISCEVSLHFVSEYTLYATYPHLMKANTPKRWIHFEHNHVRLSHLLV